MTRVILPLIIVVILILGCGCSISPGGGSFNHNPPEQIYFQSTTILMIRLASTNTISGKSISQRYTNIKCHYGFSPTKLMLTLHGRIVEENNNYIIVEFVIPEISSLTDKYEQNIYYNFEFLFDGHRNIISTISVPIFDKDE